MSILASITQEQGFKLFDQPESSKLLYKLNQLSLRLSDFNKVKKISDSPSHDLFHIFAPTSKVIQICISSSHIAFLLNTNEICRVRYRVLKPKSRNCLAFPQYDNGCNDSEFLDPKFQIRGHKASNVIPTTVFARKTRIHGQDNKTNVSESVVPTSSLRRGRGLQGLKNGTRAFNMRNISRNASSGLRRTFSVNPMRTNALDVPEDLIDQAQAVLQGKNRSLILRELQRTGLDVNQAVNNLLSRDDDGDEEESIQSILGSDELIYLFESGTGTVQLPLEIDVQDRDNFILESSLQSIRRLREPVVEGASGRESRLEFTIPNPLDNQIDRLSDFILSYSSLPGTHQPHSEINEDVKDSEVITKVIEYDTKSENFDQDIIPSTFYHSTDDLSPQILFLPDPLWWVEGEPDISSSIFPPTQSVKFRSIASTDTDLVAITYNGHFAYWPWDKHTGFCSQKQHLFPIEPKIDLNPSDKIKLLTASKYRFTVVTTSNLIASWCDRSLSVKLGPFSSSIETQFQQLRLLPNQKVISLTCCDLYSACITSGGQILWWGCLPHTDRKRAIIRIKNKCRSHNRKVRSHVGNEIQEEVIREGSFVYIIDSPLYSIGTRAICLLKDAQVGILEENVYSLNEKYRFKSEFHSKNVKSTTVDTATKFDKNTFTINPFSSEHSFSSSFTHTWHCKDVLFLDEPHFHSPLGQVIKIDGNLVVVSFSIEPIDLTRQVSMDLSSCRVVKKENLILLRTGIYPKGPISISSIPKKLSINPDWIPLSITAHNKGLYLFYTQNSIPALGIVSLVTSLIESQQFFPKSLSSFLQNSSPQLLISCCSALNTSFYLLDSLGNLLPLLKSQSNTFREVPLIPLPPVSALCSYFNSNYKFTLTILSCNHNLITPFIICPNPDLLTAQLYHPTKDRNAFQTILSEHSNGMNNIFHTAIGAPYLELNSIVTPNYETTHNLNSFFCSPIEESCNTTSTKCNEDLPKSYNQDYLSSIDALNSLNSRSLDSNSIQTVSYSNVSFADLDHESAKIPHSSFFSKGSSVNLNCFRILIDFVGPDIQRLLMEKNIYGYTPFMQAIHERNYEAALLILSVYMKTSKISEDSFFEDETLLNMIYPPNSFPDDNPLFMLCANDLCSVTWTGECHETSIDIYECRTCGLVGDFCCCTECSRVCHKGHECTKKLVPMRAFCDCRKLCCCRALLAGNQLLRLRLLKALISIGKLNTALNSHNEHILSFLVTTCSRQIKEQALRKTTYRSSKPRSNPQAVSDFSKNALELCLCDWKTVKGVLTISNTVASNRILEFEFRPRDSNIYLDYQQCSIHIERFVYHLLICSNPELITKLLTTLIQAYQDCEEEALCLISRFLRSVIRIYLVSTYELWAPTSLQYRIRNQNFLDQMQNIFRSLNKLAIIELWNVAKAIIIPIQLGIVNPCNPIPNEYRKRNLAEDLFRFSTVFTPSSKGKKSHSDFSEYKSSVSEDSESLRDETQSIATPDNSVTTRATIGSSHIVQYISGDSTSDSDEPLDECLEAALDVNHPISRGQLMYPASDFSSLSHPIPTVERTATESENFRHDLMSPLNYTPLSLRTFNENVHLGTPINTLELSNNLNTEVHTITSNQEPQQMDVPREGDRTHCHDNAEPSDQSWQPAFELLSNRNTLTSSQRHDFGHASQDSEISCSHQVQILSRAFHFLIEQIVNVVQHIFIAPIVLIPWNIIDISKCCKNVWCEMEPLLIWLINVMDPLESQLRFGSSLTSPYSAFLSKSKGKELVYPKSTLNLSASRTSLNQNDSFSNSHDNSHPPKYEQRNLSISSSPSSLGLSSLEYLLSLTRSNFNEHRDFLPPINLTSMEHVACVLDAILFFLYNQPREIPHTEYIKSDLPNTEKTLPDTAPKKNVKIELTNYESVHRDFLLQSPPNKEQDSYSLDEVLAFERNKISSFFKRSSCLSFYGCPNPSHLAPIEAIPIAEMPHLLQPHTRREILFGAPQDPIIPDPEENSPFHNITTLTSMLSLSLIKCFSHIDRLASVNCLLKSDFLLEQTRIDLQILDLQRAADIFLGRWRLSIELFCKLFYDKNRCENIRMLHLLQDFPTKEEKFRKEMEKLNYESGKEQRDLIINVSRNRSSLIFDTFQQLFSYVENHRGLISPLCVKQVKVKFKNEQGEGSGVTRSFYTSFADAILSDEMLPSLDGVLIHCDNRKSKKDLSEVPQEEAWDNYRLCPLNLKATPFHPHFFSSYTSREKILQGARIFTLVSRLVDSEYSAKITGMLLMLAPSQINSLFTSDSILSKYVHFAYDIITGQMQTGSVPSYQGLIPSNYSSDLLPHGSKRHHRPGSDETIEVLKRFKSSEIPELSPLFFEPGKCGFYSPRAGYYTAQRKLAYLCIGRIIGLCLLTDEIFPVSFSRHVLKFLMGKEDTICWQDYAFMDPVGFESLRKILILAHEENSEIFQSLELSFQISLSINECVELVNLVKNGSCIPVTINNVEYYVKLYTEFRMKHVNREALMDMQLGLSEVIPINHFSNLTPEDLRLILNGCNSFNLDNLKKIVVVNNESKEVNKTISKFIKWFWNLVQGFSESEKQELLYFWTSSPKLPSSIHSYQPEPSIHIRPPDEDHLPTANTCIARLYIPLYSSRLQLKSKLLLAIKTKTFGFV